MNFRHVLHYQAPIGSWPLIKTLCRAIPGALVNRRLLAIQLRRGKLATEYDNAGGPSCCSRSRHILYRAYKLDVGGLASMQGMALNCYHKTEDVHTDSHSIMSHFTNGKIQTT